MMSKVDRWVKRAGRRTSTNASPRPPPPPELTGGSGRARRGSGTHRPGNRRALLSTSVDIVADAAPARYGVGTRPEGGGVSSALLLRCQDPPRHNRSFSATRYW
jgi:hypothetical protein